MTITQKRAIGVSKYKGMSALSHDTSRCMGMGVQHASQPQAEWCPQRETCARYLQRASNTGPRTSCVLWACGPDGFNSKIEETK